jgi:hypothetical protein
VPVSEARPPDELEPHAERPAAIIATQAVATAAEDRRYRVQERAERAWDAAWERFMANQSDGQPASGSSPPTGASRQDAVAASPCPYCGHLNSGGASCGACGGLFEPLSRQATQNAMGPWFIRDPDAPFRPGCSYATIKALALKGRLTPESVVRGPSTRQFWTFARRTPGIAHLLGVCHACGRACGPEQVVCAACGVSFAAPDDRQHLGLSEIRLLPGRATPEELLRAARGASAMSAGLIPLDAAPSVSTGATTAASPAAASAILEPVREPATPARATRIGPGDEPPEPWGLRRGRGAVLGLLSIALVGMIVCLAVFGMLLSSAMRSAAAVPAAQNPP